MTVACTHPGRLAHGRDSLDSYWFAPSTAAREAGTRWSRQGDPPTPFLRTEGFVSAACVHRGPVGYLSLHANGDPADSRADDFPGDVRVGGSVLPGWGTHLVDMNVAQGDLIAIVEAQARAFSASATQARRSGRAPRPARRR
jgi:hypothetical protein